MNLNANEYVPSWKKGGKDEDKKGASTAAPAPVTTAPKLAVAMPKPKKAVVVSAVHAASKETQKEAPNEEIKPAAAEPVPLGSSQATSSSVVVPASVLTKVEAVSAGPVSLSVPAPESKPIAVNEITPKLDALSTSEPEVALTAREEELLREEIAEAESAKQVISDGRKTVNIVFIGHVDAGKSTISGHILYLTGGVDERTMEKYERESKAMNRESWKYAWALDLTDQERDRGKTEECGRASFNTETKRFVLLDAPGHKQYVHHMIGGASQADIAMLVISSRKGEFETGFEKGGQTREHAMLAKTSGVRQLVILINKLDDPSIVNPDGTWSKERYEECQSKLMPYLKQVGWKTGDLTWVPISGLTGLNLKVKVDKSICPWYNGESLLDTLEHLKPPERLVNSPVKMPIYEKYKEMGGTMIMGKLEAGTLKIGDKLSLLPPGKEIVVDAIFLEDAETTSAEPGDNVRLRVKGVDEDEVHPGYVACSQGSPVPVTDIIDVRLMILEHKSIITAGYNSVMHLHASITECIIEKLIGEVDKKTGEICKKFPKFAKPGMTVIARLKCSQPVCVEEFKAFPQLGRFMLRDENRTVGVGIVLKVRPSSGTLPEE